MSEEQSGLPRIAVIEREACIGCEQCVAACPVEAISMVEGIAVIDAALCTGCEECVLICPASAISMSEGPSAKPETPVAAAAEEVEEEKGPRPEVWVFVEHTDGRPAPVSWELLGKGRELANDLGGLVCSVLLGHRVDSLAKEAFAYGADKVYSIDDPALSHYRTQPYLHGVVKLVQKHKPDVMVFGATTMGRDLAGAVATSLRTGLTADCTGLRIAPETKLLEQTRPAFGGNIMATILCEKQRPQMATVRPRVMPMPPRQDGRTGAVVTERLDMAEEEILARILEYARAAPTEVTRIEDADILVSGGRGVGGPEGFKMLQELADMIGGCVSGSRGAVDRGWISHDRQVGQTGKTVRPKLYLACGISGAIQHLVGMQTSDVIVAINRDPNAPIFSVASFGVVGDVFEIVPALTRACMARLAGAARAPAASASGGKNERP